MELLAASPAVKKMSGDGHQQQGRVRLTPALAPLMSILQGRGCQEVDTSSCFSDVSSAVKKMSGGGHKQYGVVRFPPAHVPPMSIWQ